MRWCPYAPVEGHTSYQKFSSLGFTSLILSPSNSFLPILNFAQDLSFYALNSINHELLHSIQSSYLHLGRSTALLKTLIADHFLRIDFFSIALLEMPTHVGIIAVRKWTCGTRKR